ncbi:hypothetical protein AVEN_182317-1 [Araneus ventricosus]|uniref:Uncharacterized protein n=1 Tax=Araneus ventricosus TaxID=182803 RepID=A0A4Y2ICK6_ARAVE|nr:hypothetical protein AVEN_182317-1 [Araneus ventricosus]
MVRGCHKAWNCKGSVVAWWQDLGFGVRGFQVQNRIPLYEARFALNRTSNTIQLSWSGSLERGVPAQVSHSPFDRGSRLLDPSHNSLRFASNGTLI